MSLDRVVDLPRRGLRRRKPDFIALADHAREARHWEIATQLYRKALDRYPRNPGIWVQYGHALKESGELRDPDKLAQAEIAYRRALSLDPGIADTYLQLGHVLKLQGKTEDAQATYLRAFALDPAMPDPPEELKGLGWSEVNLGELKQLVAPTPANGHDIAPRMLSRLTAASKTAYPGTNPDLRPTLWFFVGDTIDWLEAHEQLTGVGRVTVELLLASLDREAAHPAIPCVRQYRPRSRVCLAVGDGVLSGLTDRHAHGLRSPERR
jgi:tetratricopeptide (TPR) repeat protein